MQTYKFSFLPPSTNAMYRCFRGHICKSARLKMFEQQILMHFDELEQDITMIDGKFTVDVSFYLKGNRDTYLDNLLKALLDGLEGILYKNDKMITSITARKFNKCKENQTVISIIPSCDPPLLAAVSALQLRGSGVP